MIYKGILGPHEGFQTLQKEPIVTSLALCLRDINSYYGKLAKAKAKAAQVESRWFVYLYTVCTQVA